MSLFIILYIFLWVVHFHQLSNDYHSHDALVTTVEAVLLAMRLLKFIIKSTNSIISQSFAQLIQSFICRIHFHLMPNRSPFGWCDTFVCIIPFFFPAFLSVYMHWIYSEMFECIIRAFFKSVFRYFLIYQWKIALYKSTLLLLFFKTSSKWTEFSLCLSYTFKIKYKGKQSRLPHWKTIKYENYDT